VNGILNFFRIHADEIKKWFLNSCAAVVVLAICWVVTYWTANKAIQEIIHEDKFTSAVLTEMGKNFVGSSYHAYFYMGRDGDDPQYSIPFYVSENQQVELYIKATHYADNKSLRDVDVFVGGKKLDRIKISSSTDYKKGFTLTVPVRQAMAEGSYDFTKNIQRIEFRLVPSKIANRNYVLVEALVITVGIPKRVDEEYSK